MRQRIPCGAQRRRDSLDVVEVAAPFRQPFELRGLDACIFDLADDEERLFVTYARISIVVRQPFQRSRRLLVAPVRVRRRLAQSHRLVPREAIEQFQVIGGSEEVLRFVLPDDSAIASASSRT